jgi:hypothetical protein
MGILAELGQTVNKKNAFCSNSQLLSENDIIDPLAMWTDRKKLYFTHDIE